MDRAKYPAARGSERIAWHIIGITAHVENLMVIAGASDAVISSPVFGLV
jgi:hypothetical protein